MLLAVFKVEAISRQPDFLIDGWLELLQLDAMSTLEGILRNLRFTDHVFWTCGLAPRFPEQHPRL